MCIQIDNKENSETYRMMMKKIFADHDYAKCHIFVACSDSFLPKDSFAAKLSLLVKFHPLLSLSTTSIFADPIKKNSVFTFIVFVNLKIKEYYLPYDCD